MKEEGNLRGLSVVSVFVYVMMTFIILQPVGGGGGGGGGGYSL
jgi:hypothetical protein